MRDLALLPKAHLHVHLESTVRWETLREIGDANGVPVPEHLAGGRTRFADFRDFADQNALVRACLQRPEDFTRVAREFCEDAAGDGTAYAEVTFTAASHGERLGDPAMPLEAVLAGLREGEAAHGVTTGVLLDHSRRRSVERARCTVDLALRHRDDGVLGWGVAGEESYPLAPFEPLARESAEAGLHLVHHAGEACDPDSIREALGAGRAERIGHGIRVLDDPDLVAEVRDREIALEVCPSSNVGLGFVPDWAAHPLPRLVAAGLRVTLNTDVPSVLGVDLSEEYARVRATFGWGDDQLADLARSGVDASFAPAPVRARMHAGIDAWASMPAG
ncbi:adenosine deaminase [Oryzihumus sp.]|uniref:adenosine deaminase n=1 Tax=Oryzihumus sp. TaxID=1968903 RepID=UPI002EDB6ECF